MKLQRIVPNLWFDNEAEEAANFYVSIFKNSKILGIDYYSESGAKVSGQSVGSVMTVSFRIEGHDFVALNGGPMFKFTPAISFMVNCRDQQEIDYFWKNLSAGGSEGQCGWLQDKFGISWQIVPAEIESLLYKKDPQTREKIMEAFFKMKKIDIDTLKNI